MPGVREAIVNYATERVRIVSDAGAVRLADLFAAIADVGYEAWPDQPSTRRAAEARERRQLLIRLGIAMLGMMQVMMYAWPVYLHGGSIPADQVMLMQWASLALTTPVVLFSAGPIFRNAWRQVRHAHVGMDVPVALGVGAAFAASVAAMVRGHGETYFDSVTMFVAFLLAARYLELRARQSATSGTEALVRQLPATCRRIADGAEATQTVPVAALQVGDCVEVRAGEILPADGVIERGTTEIDESLLSGESVPQPRGIGAMVLAGSYNAASAIWLRVHRVGAQTRLAAIVELLERALTDKPRMAELADRVAGRFVMVLLGWAVLTALAWWWIDPDRMFAVTVAVLVVSCPCALSLATPSALAAASGALARRGVLITRGHAIESLAAVTDVLLDKTGTLTQGHLRLLSIETFDDPDAQQCLALACALEQAENHPIAQSLRRRRAGAGAGGGGERRAQRAGAGRACPAADAGHPPGHPGVRGPGVRWAAAACHRARQRRAGGGRAVRRLHGNLARLRRPPAGPLRSCRYAACRCGGLPGCAACAGPAAASRFRRCAADRALVGRAPGHRACRGRRQSRR